MPKFCAVIGCNNTYKSSNVSLHEFPKAPEVRKKWEDFVKVHRSDFSVLGIRSPQSTTTGLTPTGVANAHGKHVAPVICGDHFLREDYENMLAYDLKYSSKRLLKRGAVPSVQPTKETLASLRAATKASTLTVSSSAVNGSRENNLYEKPRPPKRHKIGSVSKKLEIARLMKPTYIPVPCPEDDPIDTIQVPKRKQRKERQPSKQDVSVQANLRKPRRNKGTQVKRQTTSVGIQCNYSEEVLNEVKAPPLRDNPDSPTYPSDTTDSEGSDFEVHDSDPDYEPTIRDWAQERTDNIEEDISMPESGMLSGKQFIVSGDRLEELLQICPMCAGPASIAHQKTHGTMVIFERKCLQRSCGQKCVWRSQNMIRRMAEGNLLMSAGILFGGLQASRTLRLFDHMKVPRISESTFYRHQRLYLEPVIISTWMEQQEHLMARLRDLGGRVIVSGDGRCDSPGYCAKFGAYTLIESRINRVIALELVQSNEVPNSSWMENEGLKRCVNDLCGRCPKIGTIVTDRHKQNNAWIRDNLTKNDQTSHYYDIWHVAKGVGKKIHKLSNQHECGDAGLWKKAIINHLYWSAGSTQDGNSDVMKAKWLSCLNHMINIHEHENPHFETCAHGPVEGAKWLQAGSKVMEKLSEIVENKYLVPDIGRLSPKHQTSALESFHALIINFAPKSTAFSFMGMKCRLLLAAMHYNENASRPLAFTKQNEPRFAVAFSRSTYGEPFLRQEKADPTFSYVNVLTAKLLDWYRTSPSRFSEVLLAAHIPSTLASTKEKPSKEELLNKRVKRFVQD